MRAFAASAPRVAPAATPRTAGVPLARAAKRHPAPAPDRAPRSHRGATTRRAAIMSPTLEVAPSASTPEKVHLVAIVPDAPSFLPSPPGIPESYLPAGPGPDWMEVMSHMALRLTWVDPGFSMDVFLHDADPALIDVSAARADVFVVVGVRDDALAARLADQLAAVPTGAALGCCDALDAQSRVVFQPVNDLRAMEAKLNPWGRASKDLRLMEQVRGLFSRENHLDLLFLHLLLVDASGTRVPAVDINQDLNVGNVWCIAKNCNKQLLACYQNDRCRLSLDCIDGCGLNDQVCTYTCIRSYQNDQFQMLSRCMLHKHNCLGNDATRPELPEVLPMTTFRGKPLTHDVAEQIMQGWYGDGPEDKPYSWLAVAGQNPAYDHFPCQYQIWYRGKAKGSFWYNPVFKVQTLDGKEVWRRSDYRCKRGDVPGTFYFSFMDNGVTSLEYWRIVDAADDLSWSLYYYAGAAKVAGQVRRAFEFEPHARFFPSFDHPTLAATPLDGTVADSSTPLLPTPPRSQAYIGAVLATKDGMWPDPSHLPRIERSLWEGCGVKLWEMCEVDNCECGGAPLEPYHDPVLMPSLAGGE